MQEQALDTVKTAVTARSIFTSIKENRIEVLLVVLLAHVLGVSDRVLASVSGMCL